MAATHEQVVLLVDEDPGDVRLLELALARTRRHVRLHCVSNASAALRFLRREIPFEDAPAVDLVLLDLHLHAAASTACLSELRADPAYAALPIIAFSSTNDQIALQEVYRLGVSAVIARPQGLHDLVTALDATLTFFLDTASRPGQRRHT